MATKTDPTIFSCAKLEFKTASGRGRNPAEGVAVQVRFEDDSSIIMQASNRDANPISKIYRFLQPSGDSLSQKFTIEAIAFATELDTENGEVLNPSANSVVALPLLLNRQDERPPIFIVGGHSMDDSAIREYHLP